MIDTEPQAPGTLAMANEKQSETLSNIPTKLKAELIRSEDLFKGERQVLIAHGSEVYRLLHTKNGKLILQK